MQSSNPKGYVIINGYTVPVEKLLSLVEAALDGEQANAQLDMIGTMTVTAPATNNAVWPSQYNRNPGI